MKLPLQSMAWDRVRAILGAARINRCQPLTTPGARLRALAARLLRFAQDDVEAERESVDPSIWTPSIVWTSGDETMDLCAIDLETTGFDPSVDAITEIGAVRCDPHFRIRQMVHVCVRVPSDHPRSDWQREHTLWGRSDPAEWHEKAMPLSLALATAGALIDGAAPIAHHLPFEEKFLLAAYKKIGDKTLPGYKWVHHNDWLRGSIDTRELASPLKARGLVLSDNGHPTRSLEPTCRALGISHDPHHALSDALASLELAKIILAGEV